MPKGYAVILTPGGLDYYGSVLGSFPELRQFEDDIIADKLYKESIQRLDNLIIQQQRIEKELGPINLMEAYKQYSITAKPITLEQIVKEIKSETDKTNDAIEKYKIQKKYFDKVMTDYHKLVTQISKTIAEMQIAGKISNATAYVAELKRIMTTLKKEQHEVINLEKILTSIEASETTQVEKIESLEDNLKALCQRYVDAGTYNIKLSAEKDKNNNITNYKVNVSQIMVEGISQEAKQERTRIARAISRYLNSVLKQIGTNKEAIQKFNRKKYTSAKGKLNSISRQMSDAISAIDSQIDAATKAIKNSSRTRGRATMTNIINKLTPLLAEAIEEGKTGEITISSSLGGDDSAMIGSFVETIHSVKPLWDKNKIVEEVIEEDSNVVIEIINTGHLKRLVGVPVEYNEETLIKEGKVKTSEWHLETDKNGDKLYKDIQFIPEDDKIDNLIKVSVNKKPYYIAFSDKFKNSHQLQAVGLVGSSFLDKNTLKITPSNLASSLDLLGNTDENLTEALVFTMLNMSSASILSNGENTAYLEETIKAMVMAHFQEFSFNLNNFIKNVADSIAPDISNKNTLLVFNLTDGLFVKSSEVLLGLKKQLEKLPLIEDIVTVQATYDTVHRAYPLWNASLHVHPRDRDARWNWVANQIARNTSISIVMNTQALMQIF